MGSCLNIMKALDYTVLGSMPISDFLSGIAEWKGDPDLLAVPPQRRSEVSAMRSNPWFATGGEL